MIVEKISATQLFCLIVLFELGSAVVVGVGLEAKQAVWATITIGTLSGLVLFIIYDYIIKSKHDCTFIEILRMKVGTLVGTIISIVYIAYFLYIAARVLRDFGGIMVSTILYGTPILAVMTVIILSVVIGCVSGTEVFGRMAEVFFPYVVLFGGLLIAFIYIAGLPNPDNLRPITGEGLLPALKATLPEIITFPFGEVVVFLMFLPLLNKPELSKKAGFISILVSGVILLIVNLTIISVLGADRATSSLLPLVDALGEVNIADFIQRLDPLAMVVLIVCGYFKITVFMCGAAIGLNELTKNKFKRYIPYITGLVTLFLSVLTAENLIEHLKIGLEIVPRYIHMPFQIIIPCTLAFIIFIKEKVN